MVGCNDMVRCYGEICCYSVMWWYDKMPFLDFLSLILNEREAHIFILKSYMC